MQGFLLMNNKLVSILLTTFNAERFIKKTIESCLNQTYEDIEILILDNASQDSTLTIIERFSDLKIKLFKKNKNIGPYEGLNLLLEKSRGKYIAIQDHDDIWFPEKIEKQVSFLENNPEFIACGTDVYYFFEKKSVMILKNFPAISSYVTHTSLIFRNKGFRYKTSSAFPEEHFEKNILSKSGKIGCVQEGLCIHRIRSDEKNLSILRSINLKAIKEVLTMGNFTRKAWSYALYLAIKPWLSKNCLWFIRRNFTMKKLEWMDLVKFNKKYPKINL